MSKNGFILDYEQKCENIISINDNKKANELVTEIIAVFENEIPNIASQLDSYSWGHLDGSSPDYVNDLKLLNAKLENYRLTLKKTPPISQSDNQMTFNINNSSNSYAKNEVSILYNQTISSINELPESILSLKDKQELEDKLASLQKSTETDDKIKIWTKLKNALVFALEKGPEVIIAISGFINSIANNIAPLFKK